MASATRVKFKKRGPKPRPQKEVRTSIIAIRCTADFKSWVEKLADNYRLNPSFLIEHALIKFAEASQIGPPPKR